MLIDLVVAQHLSSRLCHDLVGAAGAVNTGLELFAEEGPETAADAFELAVRSGQEVARRLSFFRVAFGSGGGGGSRTSLAEARKLVVGLLEDRSIDVDWPDDNGLGDSLRAVQTSHVRLLFNLVLLAVDSLPRGGVIAVRFADLEDGFGFALTATGTGARLREECAQAMDPDATADDLTARNVQAFFAVRLAESLGTGIEVSTAGPDSVQLAVLIPADTDPAV